jgi:hypothetical protein
VQNASWNREDGERCLVYDMIQIRVCKDEIGVRIDFLADTDDFEYRDYITSNAALKVWDSEAEMVMFLHNGVLKMMSVIDDQLLHEQFVERKEVMDGSVQG